VHVVLIPALPEKVSLLRTSVPRAPVLPVSSAAGHLMDRPLILLVASGVTAMTALVEVADTLVLTGVRVAWAGVAAAAQTVSNTVAKMTPRRGALRIRCPFLRVDLDDGRYPCRVLSLLGWERWQAATAT
jgi:hypothetical protein